MLCLALLALWDEGTIAGRESARGEVTRLMLRMSGDAAELRVETRLGIV